MKINIISNHDEIQVGEKTFLIGYTDESIKRYFEAGKKVFEMTDDEKMTNFADEKDFRKVAQGVIDTLRTASSSLIEFFDIVLGQGKGNEMYHACGDMTSNMSLVFVKVWSLINDHLNTTNPGIETAKKYVKNKNVAQAMKGDAQSKAAIR